MPSDSEKPAKFGDVEASMAAVKQISKTNESAAKKQSEPPTVPVSMYAQEAEEAPDAPWLWRALIWAAFLGAPLLFGQISTLHKFDPSQLQSKSVIQAGEAICALLWFGFVGYALYGSSLKLPWMQPKNAGSALGLMLGRGLVLVVPAVMLLVLSEAWLKAPDGHWLDPTNAGDLHDGCVNPLGYCMHLSCVAGNLSSRVYTWLLVVSTSMGFIFTAALPFVLTLPADIHKKMVGYVPIKELFGIKVLFISGSTLLIVTAVAPWTYPGTSSDPATKVSNTLHEVGVVVFVAMVIVPIYGYVYLILREKAQKHPQRCIPHVVVVLVVTQALTFMLSFISLQWPEQHPSRINVCMLRNPAQNPPCGLSAKFNRTAYEEFYDLQNETAVACTYDTITNTCINQQCAYFSYALAYTLEVTGLTVAMFGGLCFCCLPLFDADVIWGAS